MAKASALQKAPAPRAAKAANPAKPARPEPSLAPASTSAPARRKNDLVIRFAFAAAVAIGAVLLAWRGSAPRVTLPIPIPPPRPVIAAVPPPAPAPVATPTATPAPNPPLAAPLALGPVPVPVPSPSPAPVENPKMTPREEAAFNVWLTGAYKRCWSSPGAPPDGEPYLPKIRVAYKSDGALAGAPKLINPPSDPAWRPQADAALRAVKACDPLHVPDKYATFYRQWKTRTVYFDPAAP